MLETRSADASDCARGLSGQHFSSVRGLGNMAPNYEYHQSWQPLSAPLIWDGASLWWVGRPGRERGERPAVEPDPLVGRHETSVADCQVRSQGFMGHPRTPGKDLFYIHVIDYRLDNPSKGTQGGR